MEYLKSEDKKIYLISGGFHSLIDPVSKTMPNHQMYFNLSSFFSWKKGRPRARHSPHKSLCQ